MEPQLVIAELLDRTKRPPWAADATGPRRLGTSYLHASLIRLATHREQGRFWSHDLCSSLQGTQALDDRARRERPVPGNESAPEDISDTVLWGALDSPSSSKSSGLNGCEG